MNGVCNPTSSAAPASGAGSTGARASAPAPVPTSVRPAKGKCPTGYTLVGLACVWAVHY
jgi:hypothetical protein